MRKKRVILVGFINNGNVPSGGEIMKNQLFIKRFTELGATVIPMDFYRWRTHPWIFVDLIWNILSKPDATIVFSTSLSNSYPLIKMMRFWGIKRHCIHWVIGGLVHKKIENGDYNVEVLKTISWNIVQIPSMVDSLKKSGLKNTIFVPNSKPISYIPHVNREKDKCHFVFLSGIKKEKGCDYIFESVKRLNDAGLGHKFDVVFYGNVFPEYKEDFMSRVNEFENVSYNGILNLLSNEGYDKLAKNHVMLFPTYWKGEGFAGVFIDAFIASLPIIASDWGHNKEFLEEGKNAIIVATHSVDALTEAMRKCINHDFNLEDMAEYSEKQAKKYDMNSVITEELLKKIGIL